MKNEKPSKSIADAISAVTATPEKTAPPAIEGAAALAAPASASVPTKAVKPSSRYLSTPDGRYFIARGKLLRCSNPNLSPADREKYSALLVLARKEVRSATTWGPPEAVQKAHRKVDAAKQGLGERGKPWWTDGAPDYNRQPIEETPYAEWWNHHGAAGKK